jgi:hypothetical protein
MRMPIHIAPYACALQISPDNSSIGNRQFQFVLKHKVSGDNYNKRHNICSIKERDKVNPEDKIRSKEYKKKIK